MATGRWMVVVGMLVLAGCGGWGGDGGGQGGDGGDGGQPVCGDGRVDPGELCDDGNDVDTDACPTTCELAACGDGFVQGGLEACDDGNLQGGDGCSAVCLLETLPACGDGITDEGEECDDGNDVETDACLSSCVNARCGDGIVWANLEDCDDGNTEDGDGCSASCQLEQQVPACGNGVVEAGERCDDGNTEDGDGCSASCELEQQVPACGNGVVEAGERCDDGNLYEADSCSATCDEERQYEVEVNDDVRWPDAIDTDLVVLGSIAKGDVDHYAFVAIPGVTTSLHVAAPGEVCDPETAPAMQLLDEEGEEVGAKLQPCETLYLLAGEFTVYKLRLTPTVDGLVPYTLAMR